MEFFILFFKKFCGSALTDHQIPLMKYIRGTTKKKDVYILECGSFIHLFSKYLLSDQLCTRYCADLVVIKIVISISFSEFNLPCVPLSIEMQDTEMNMGSYEHLWTFNF